MHPLEEKISYSFSNSSLLNEALTHPSMGYELKDDCTDNQRLEFLGDSVLQLTLTELIFTEFTGYDEGEMTKLRSRLVSKEALHAFALKISLNQHMLMGKGEKAVGGQNRASTLADGLEALIGAIYLDGGFDQAFEFIKTLIADDIHIAATNPTEKNPKGKLQEILQAIIPESPIYEVISESGPDHNKVFLTRILWNNETLAEGKGSSKKLAEIAAAKAALNRKTWTSNNLK